jgi:hypothetical protein
MNMNNNLAAKRKKEDPKKVYERLKKHRQNTRFEKLEITGLDPKIKEEFKELKGLEVLTNAFKLKKLIDLWNGKNEPIQFYDYKENKVKPIDKTVREDEFNKIVEELVRLQLKSNETDLKKGAKQKNPVPSNNQFKSFLKSLKHKKNVRYETVLNFEEIHNLFEIQLIRQVDIDVESALGKGHGETFFILISRKLEPDIVVSYMDSSFDTALKYFNKVKYSKKQAKDKFDFLSGKWS